MSKNIVFEGWLTKSPPIKRIWRTKWRRRWFALRQSGELPGQYFLDYYADRNCRRLKGTINLDLCEQVDAGLHMERNSHGTLDPKLRGSVFTIQTQSRTYHLEADCEADMEKWVDAICRVCGLRATEESPEVIVTYQNNLSPISVANEQYECADTTGPYIPISECITGVRAQDPKRAFTFDPKNIVISTRTPFERNARLQQMYMSQPHIRPPNNNAEFSENDSNLSEDESRSLNASQSNIRDWAVAKSFTKSAASPHRNGFSDDGPPVPPRPPKTFAKTKDVPQKESFQTVRFLEPTETAFKEWDTKYMEGDISERTPLMQLLHYTFYVLNKCLHYPFMQPVCVQPGRTFPCVRTSRRAPGTASPSPRRSAHVAARYHDDDDGYTLDQLSMQYCNLSIIPPTVDRNLKPRHSSHSIGQYNFLSGQTMVHSNPHEELKSDALQYLDLDLQTSKDRGALTNEGCDSIVGSYRRRTSPRTTAVQVHKPAAAQPQVVPKTLIDIHHTKSLSAADTDSAYKTVDFLKTEAFNITRQDAEASRSNQQ